MKGNIMQTFSKVNLPKDGEGWSLFREKLITKAIRIQGEFQVETKEGILSCNDGWLALDSRGYPYPIADEEFRQMYEEV